MGKTGSFIDSIPHRIPAHKIFFFLFSFFSIFDFQIFSFSEFSFFIFFGNEGLHHIGFAGLLPLRPSVFSPVSRYLNPYRLKTAFWPQNVCFLDVRL